MLGSFPIVLWAPASQFQKSQKMFLAPHRHCWWLQLQEGTHCKTEKGMKIPVYVDTIARLVGELTIAYLLVWG